MSSSFFLSQLQVDRGMPSTHRFTFHGEGDHDPGKEQGDIVIQLEEKEHGIFQRHGCDLSMKMDLSLAEALCGFRAPIETLDKRTIVVSTAPGEVITHGAMKTVAEEGFPKHKDPFNKGRLIIVFNVQFPSALSAEATKKLRQALPKGPQRPAIPEDAGNVSYLRRILFPHSYHLSNDSISGVTFIWTDGLTF